MFHLFYKSRMLRFREVLQIIQVQSQGSIPVFRTSKCKSFSWMDRHEQVLSLAILIYCDTFFTRKELGCISVWLAWENKHLTQGNLRRQMDLGTTRCFQMSCKTSKTIVRNALAHTFLDYKIPSLHITLYAYDKSTLTYHLFIINLLIKYIYICI